jgi:hypothetical protein
MLKKDKVRMKGRVLFVVPRRLNKRMSARFIKLVAAFARRDQVSGVLLSYNSRGGSADSWRTFGTMPIGTGE